MKFKAQPQQTLLILSMLFGETPEEREPTWKKAGLKPAKLRTELEEAGFVRSEKRGRANHLILEDAAWDFALENLAGDLPPNKQRAGKLLRAILVKIHHFLHTQEYSLVHLVRGKAFATATGADVLAHAGGAIAPNEDQIRAACLDLTRGQTRQRVRLSDLRRKVPADRDALDRMLLDMQKAGRLVLFKMDNPADITPDDERAALLIAGQPRHLVYLEA